MSYAIVVKQKIKYHILVFEIDDLDDAKEKFVDLCYKFSNFPDTSIALCIDWNEPHECIMKEFFTTRPGV